MTAADLAQIESFFHAYTARFADANGALHRMQHLKVKHSHHVVANAEQIMAAQDWPQPDRLTGAACALLHDIGRFSQYAQYGSFEDKRSINHAERGAEILRTERVLDTLPIAERAIILACVRLHSVRELPPDLQPATARFAHLLRDADKLDIFRIFEDAIRQGHLDDHPEIAWSLDRSAGVNSEMLACVREGRTAEYSLVRSLADLMMIQVGWLHSQIHYDATLALAMERGALDFRETFICGLDPATATAECFAAVRETITHRQAGRCRSGRNVTA
jgi:putative nucleotidyltransferase with HDIG domain